MSQRGRKCECCGPVCGGIDRRDFIKTAAAGAVGLAVGSGSLSEAAAEAKPYWIENQLPPEKLAEWRKHVLDLTPPRIYSSRRNPDARFPLGGIGTGNFYIGTDGRMTGWSVTNGGGELDIGEPFFAIRAAAGKAAPVVRVLSTRPPESTRGVADIEMTGEYPIAELRYRDTDLPIQVSLTTHTPFVPLDSKRSAYPAAIFQFHLKNRTRKRMRVSLMAAMPNCVGLAGWGRRTESSGSASGLRHPNYGGNFNEFGKAGELRMIRFRAAEGQAASCDSAVRFFVHASESDFDRTWRRASRHERPDNVTIVRANPSGAIVKQIESASESARVIWLENPTAVPLDFAKALGLAAKAGATVVFSGDDAAVLRRLTSSTLAVEKKGLPDIVFDDFESGSYANWTVEGEAFGKAPQSGTLPRQQPVSGFLGKRLVNSFVGGDGTTGKMTSKPFTIERPLISFLIGGGSDPDRTCMRLVVDNKPVRVATGRNNERLDWQVWDVREFVGKRGQLEIVDSARGPWGHINVDHIVFTENAPEDKLAAVLRDVLPVTFSDVVVHEEPTPALTLPRGEKRRGAQFRFDAWAEYKDLQLLSGGE
ncbi:twin-arginine translocation signal domain-containing protein, partial [Candidatus Sumerlaeota bacterium]|nr:twin-arginine translocation signal domain-containing protein [Candidatus Sumerlaeota bacterium]